MQDDTAMLHPGQLFHVGVVVGDIDVAMAEMTRSLGVQWKGGRSELQTLRLSGELRQVEMRIAHTVQGPPHIELIQAVADTPWDIRTGRGGCHHLCYWSADSAAVLSRLEASGGVRILGESGHDSGYVRMPTGTLIEIIPISLRDHLTQWFARGRQLVPAAGL